MPLSSKQNTGHSKCNFRTGGSKTSVRSLLAGVVLIALLSTSAAAPFETSWVTTGTIQYGWFGYSISTARDINGDGFDDIIISQANVPDSISKALIYYGSATGLPAQPGTRIPMPDGMSEFGEIVEDAGDVNNDGFDDVMVVGSAGGRKVFLYYGSSDGLTTTSYWTSTIEGYADCGRQLTSAGDVNNDGYSDIMFTAYTYSPEGKQEGSVWIFHGSASGPPSTPDTVIPFHSLIWDRLRISAAGDINNDGFDDIVASYPHRSEIATNAGRAQVHYGTLAGISSTPSLVINGLQSQSLLNVETSLGDYNNDGYADVRLNDEHIGTRIYLGSAAGLSQATYAIPDHRHMSLAGDVDGNGYQDILSANEIYAVSDSQEGIAYVHFGAAGPMSWTNPWIKEGTVRLGYFGYPISTAGDVNGDGYDDIMISERGVPLGYCRVHVFYGAPRESKVYDWNLF